MTDTGAEKPSTALFNSILEKAGHPKTKRAAENIKKACDYLDEKNLHITIAEIGVFCEASGPKTQSIHNNKEFVAYIKARQAEQQLQVKPSNGPTRFESADPQANAIIYALQVEKRRLEQSIHNLKRALADAGDYDLEATLKTGRLVRLVQEKAAPVSGAVVDTIRRLLDPAHMVKFGLKRHQDRIVAVDRNNRVFIEKADLQRLTVLAQEENKVSTVTNCTPQVETRKTVANFSSRALNAHVAGRVGQCRSATRAAWPRGLRHSAWPINHPTGKSFVG